MKKCKLPRPEPKCNISCCHKLKKYTNHCTLTWAYEKYYFFSNAILINCIASFSLYEIFFSVFLWLVSLLLYEILFISCTYINKKVANILITVIKALTFQFPCKISYVLVNVLIITLLRVRIVQTYFLLKEKGCTMYIHEHTEMSCISNFTQLKVSNSLFLW